MFALLNSRPVAWLGALGVLVALIAGSYGLGNWRGRAAVQARWDTAVSVEKAREDTIAEATKSLSAQLVAEIHLRLDTLEHDQMEAIDAAQKADAAPVDGRCSDVRRGLPSGVVQSLDRIK